MMTRTEGKLMIYLLRLDIMSKNGLSRSNFYVTSSRHANVGDVSDAAIFRSRSSAEKAIKKIMGIYEYFHMESEFKNYRFHVEEHEIEIDMSPYIPFG